MAVKCYKHLKEMYAKEFSEINEMFYGLQVTELSSLDNTIIHSVKP